MKHKMLYVKLINLSIKGQISYKKDFIIEFIIWSIYSLMPFFSLTLLLEKFVKIGELSIYQIAVLYGISQASYDIARMLGRGFDNFTSLVMNGDFDVFYIRPLPIIYQIFASDVFMRRIAGILQGSIIMYWGIAEINILTYTTIFRVLFIMLSATLMYMGLFIMNASVVLITVRDSSFVSYLIDLAAQSGYYPINLIKNPLKVLLTFVLPIGLCIYYPTYSLFTKTNYFKNISIGLCIGGSFFGIGILLFHFCRKFYISVNN